MPTMWEFVTGTTKLTFEEDLSAIFLLVLNLWHFGMSVIDKVCCSYIDEDIFSKSKRAIW